jgi:hypothetical protein
MARPLRSSRARKTTKPENSVESRGNLLQRATALSGWDNEGGETLSGPQQRRSPIRRIG